MDRATDDEAAFAIELKRDRIADGLLAGVEFHLRLIDINMMRDAVVILNSHHGARRDTQCIGGKSSAALTDGQSIRRETRDCNGGRHRHRDQRQFDTHFIRPTRTIRFR